MKIRINWIKVGFELDPSFLLMHSLPSVQTRLGRLPAQHSLSSKHTLTQPTSKIKPSCLPSQRIPNGISFCLSKAVWTSHTDVPVSFLFHVGDFFPCSFPPSSIDSVTLTSASPNLHSSLHLHLYDQRNKVLTGKSLAESCWNHHRRERRGKRHWTWKADSARVPNLCACR